METSNTPAPTRFQITLAGRIGRTPATMYLTGVSYADGPGFRIKKLSYGPKVDHAMSFSRAAADAIARQICTKYREVRVVGALQNERIEPNADQRAAIAFQQAASRAAAENFNAILTAALGPVLIAQLKGGR